MQQSRGAKHLLIWVFLGFVGTSCSHRDRPAPASPPAPAATKEKIDRGPTSTDSDIGGLSQEDVEDEFKALHPRFLDCVQRSSTRLNCLGGKASVRLRISRKGEVQWAYLTDSTLGDREAERCVLEVVRRQIWPRPLSGDGLAESSFEVDPAETPARWPAFKTTALADKATAASRSCRKGIRGAFRATAYIGSKGGVLAAGVAPPGPKTEEAVDCIVEAVRGLHVGHLTVGQRGPAKVSFLIR